MVKDKANKTLSAQGAESYIKEHLHMTDLKKLHSPDTDYYFFKGNNEEGQWKEIRIQRTAGDKYHSVWERPWEFRYEHAWEMIDLIPVWNGEASDDVDQYLPK